MERRTTTSKTMQEEQEVTINIYRDTESSEWIAELDTNVQKYATKCIKAGWEQTSETRHTSGTWVAATFKAPARALSFRNINTLDTKRVLSDEQRQKLSEKMKAMRNIQN